MWFYAHLCGTGCGQAQTWLCTDPNTRGSGVLCVVVKSAELAGDVTSGEMVLIL